MPVCRFIVLFFVPPSVKCLARFILFSLLPTMISQAGDMAWLGSSGGCAVYYFITSWLVGLSNYLVVCLVCMILVLKRYFSFVDLLNSYFPGQESSLRSGSTARVQIPPLILGGDHRPAGHPGALHQVHHRLLWPGHLHSLHKVRFFCLKTFTIFLLS